MTKSEIAAVLKDLRVKSGKTQKEVAKLIGRGQQVIGHWETGYSQPDANTLFVLCEIYGSTVDSAFGFKNASTLLSMSDSKLVKRYNNLDVYGKKAVDGLIEVELERMNAVKENTASYNECKRINNIPLYDMPASAISLNAEYEDIYFQEYHDMRCKGKVLGVLDEPLLV